MGREHGGRGGRGWVGRERRGRTVGRLQQGWGRGGERGRGAILRRATGCALAVREPDSCVSRGGAYTQCRQRRGRWAPFSTPA